ncbi:peptidyl-prolyl cis-trans isomerase B (cyclophilin B) [Cytobacillus eiseniae]|uniref:Peptidyl-prolyl cis-trans isomerase n=1 Tax=Cytobacillus eiseniae TaxID=762947 RepID=A0ABS4R9R3_9BACI|nr:peptidylprolyl isomerase [Cytobacillus eiseniae]MBP2239637.1 peptidyl-prolyl cis-trans isomerase B (cyclophilin B) [Cytobacillus eiseniae]
MFLRNKAFSFLFLALVVVFMMAGCGSTPEEQPSENTGDSSNQSNTNSDYSSDVEENPIVTITMDNDEVITLELYPKTAPNTVANYISLIENGFYDGLIFHRVIPGFMIQGGDPSGNGTGGPGYAIFGEFTDNGFENPLKHERGVLSMARTGDPNSAGSQFFIMVEDSANLDGQYAAFGKVLEGMEVVDRIVATERNGADLPLEEQRMKTVKVDTKGFDYPDPTKQ